MNAIRRIRAIALCLAACVVPAHASAAELSLPRDGWASWEVPAVEDAPDWCCFNHSNSAETTRGPCVLDSERSRYGAREGETTASIRVYVRLGDGRIERLRVFSESCPVQIDSAVRNLGSMSADDSARWLNEVVQGRELGAGRHGRVVGDALAALAMHRGEAAHGALVELARSDTTEEHRKQAVFWLARLRGIKGAEVATAIMFADADTDIREHAAFAVSQSKSPHADSDLIRLATTDSAANVRGHAWFSLALTKSARTEEAIGRALRTETDRAVREQAVFALSQLPNERATRALIKVAEDTSLAREERKRAVFWLAQSESGAAQTYLEAMLTNVLP